MDRKDWSFHTLKKFRSQKSMTRDPYINCIVACLKIGVSIDDIKLPWNLYRPEVWQWRKRLYKKHKLSYVIGLRYKRAKATVIDYENKRTDY